MDDVLSRLLNPGIIFAMVAAGAAYSVLLWALHIQPTSRLVMTSVAPGAIFTAMIWAVRAAQGTASLVYPILLVLWLVFSVTGVAVVIVRRRRHG